MGAKAGRSGGTPGTACSSLLYPVRLEQLTLREKKLKWGKKKKNNNKKPSLGEKIAKSEKEGEKDRAPTYAETSPPIPANTYVGEEGGYAIKS